MIQRQTQTAQYWDEAFSIEDADLEHLYTLLLEDETPLTTDELVLALVCRRVEREDRPCTWSASLVWALSWSAYRLLSAQPSPAFWTRTPSATTAIARR